jgi:radical SAM superfamily enzyme YgiQ (UPF0313 family)/bacterioferritin-associated ferredoxin
MRVLVTTIPGQTREPASGSSSGSLDVARPSDGTSPYHAYELARLRSHLTALGHQVCAADVSASTYAQLVALLTRFAPDAAIVDASSFQDHTERHALFDWFLLVKSVNPRIRTVWGGRDAGPLADFALTHATVLDLVLCDESDSTFPPVLQRWAQDGPLADLSEFPGLAFRRQGMPHRTRALEPKELVALDTLPFLDYEGFEFAPTDKPLVMSSRGCPFGCTFCYRQYRSWRAHSPAYFVEHLEHLVTRFGFHRLTVDDELFTLDRERCLHICDEIVRRDLSLAFDCYSRVDTFDLELAHELKRAGCHMVWMGLESGSDELLNLMVKGQTRRVADAAVAAARKAGLKICFNVLLGYPGETRRSVLSTLKMLAELRPDRISVQRLRIMAGTPLFESCKREGVVDDEAWLLGDRDLAYERHFSRDGLDAAKDAVSDLQGTQDVPVEVLQYLALKTNLPVCRCHAVGEEEMRCAVGSGAVTVKMVRDRTGAVSGCGACASIIHSFLRVIARTEDPVLLADHDTVLQP